MRKSILVALCLAGMAAPLGSAGVQAASLPKLAPIASEASAVEPVHYYGYCRSWRHECAARWGWGTWRYRRCLSIRGCL